MNKLTAPMASDLLGLLLAPVDASLDSYSTTTTTNSSSQVAEGESSVYRFGVVCLLVVFLLLTLAGLVQFVRLLMVRYLPCVMTHKAYAALLTVAALCLSTTTTTTASKNPLHHANQPPHQQSACCSFH